MLILSGLFLAAPLIFFTPTPPEPVLSVSTTEEIRTYVKQEAIRNGVSTTVALWIVEKESQFDPTRTGDDDKICGRTGEQQRSRGLWQISDCYHPGVTDECAYDPICSTEWALKHLKRGYARQWSVFRFCKAWWPASCPL